MQPRRRPSRAARTVALGACLRSAALVAAVGVGTPPVCAETLAAGDTLCIQFSVQPPYSPTSPDVLLLHLGLIQVFQPYTARVSVLFDGPNELGVHRDTTLGGYVGMLNLEPASAWVAPGSAYTFLNPAVVDFTSIWDGTIEGRIEFTIETGSVEIPIGQVHLALLAASAASGGTLIDPPPVITSMGVSVGAGCPTVEPGHPFCPGDGSGALCPCGNFGAAGEGCATSNGAGGLLLAGGTADAVADDLTFQAQHLLPNQPALLFAAANAVNGGLGVPFGDGLRCAGGSVKRLGVVIPNASGEASWGPGLNGGAGALQWWSPGDTRRFQAWFRDPPGPCGTGFNLSNGYEVTFF